jgi:hypothetical protein
MDQVLQQSLIRMPVPIEWDETAVSAKPVPAAEDESPGLVAH